MFQHSQSIADRAIVTATLALTYPCYAIAAWLLPTPHDFSEVLCQVILALFLTWAGHYLLLFALVAVLLIAVLLRDDSDELAYYEN